MRSARQMHCESSWRRSRRPNPPSRGESAREGAPAGYCSDALKGGWFDENGKPFELADPPRKEAACSVAAERTAALQETKQELTQTFRSLYPNAAHSTPGTPTIHTYYTYYTSYTPTTPGYGITLLIPPAKAV